MDKDRAVAFIITQSVCAQAEIFGMQAENMQRAHRGESMAYTMESFVAVEQKYEIGHNEVLTYLQRFE